MNSFRISPLRPVEASTVGALSGFSARCTCGLEIRSSLKSLAEQDCRDHADWHEKRRPGA